MVFSLSRSNRLPGPASEGYQAGAPYHPVSCEFTDELEHAIVRKIPLTLQFMSEQGAKVIENVLLSDLINTGDGEFLILEEGTRVRIDHIVELRMDVA